MIISSRQRLLEDGALLLGPISLGVLSSAVPTECSALIESELQEGGLCEIVVSAIPKQYWHDLWRLEIETENRIGTVQRIMEVLWANKVDVLFQETSSDAFGEWNTTSMIVSGRRYSNEVDKSADIRMAQPHCDLVFLESALQLAILDQLRFSEDGLPRFRLGRIELYRNLLKKGILARARFIEMEGASINEKLELKLTNKAQRHLKRLFPAGDIHYQVAVDTKSRLSRVLLHGDTGQVFFDVRFLLNFAATAEQLTVFTAIKKAGFNIIRHRIRILPKRQEDEADSDEGQLAELVVSMSRATGGETKLLGDCKLKLKKEIDTIAKIIRENGGEDQSHIMVM
jgi:hypothetical protein